MNIIDKAIAIISPKAGLERARSRYLLEVIGKRAYDAASYGRRTDGWKSNGASANNELNRAVKTLRDRSRELCRNNPYAIKAVRDIKLNTIGSGIRPAIKSESKITIKKLKKAWKDWAETTQCDFDGENDIYGLQGLVVRTVAESGECLVLKKVYKKGIIPFQLQVLEPDFIDTIKFRAKSNNQGAIINGVEYDVDGRKVGYWLFESHPGDIYGYNIVSKFVSINEVAHIYYKERPGQNRGVVMSAPSMTRLRDFDDFEDAELMKQKIAACFAAFITDPNDVTGQQSNTNNIEAIEPGAIEYLSPGKEVTFSNPPSRDGHGEFATSSLRGISAGFGVTYEGMTGDLSQVNFSSGRMGRIGFQKQISDWQLNMTIPMLCNKTWDWFMEGCMIAGIIRERVSCDWTCPRNEMIDPVKEADGLKQMVRAGFMSWAEAVRKQGYEPDEMILEMKQYYDEFANLGLQLDTDPRYDKGKVVANSKAN
jgi:lambda family phage portal protein